jgi:hypothetical protein
MPTTYAIPDGRTVMAATTYTGNGGTVSISNAVNGVSFQPDWVWIKNRAAAVNHQLQNSNAGWQYGLNSNNTNAEYTDASAITGSTSSGWSMNNNYNSHNQSGISYVGWNWKAGGTAVSNTSGTITSQVSANPTAGFSVVTYTGTGANATVGHGLGVAPSFMIVRKRNGIEDWPVYHASLGNTQKIFLDLTNASATDSTMWNNTTPTSSVFSIGTNAGTNNVGYNFVAYCFAAVAGYSAFGSYTGNGSTDGTFVYLGFKPRWLMVKCTSNAATTWFILDTSRDTYNLSGQSLEPNRTDAEYTPATSGYYGDILSNGFKWRDASNNANNANGYTYIYAAFAENPFKYANAR